MLTLPPYTEVSGRLPLHLESNWWSKEKRSLQEEIMGKELRALFALALFAAPMVALPNPAAAQPQDEKKQRSEVKYKEKLSKEVRHQLVMLPWYSVFDNLAYKVEGDKVTLYGEVTRPTLKSDAEAAVKSIEGVASVVNNIEVLPLSPMDDQLRRAVYRAIYGESALSRYSIQAVPSIHIVVKNGSVTLEGVVDNETDKNLANLRANQVPNVFSVKNNLVVAGGGK
jgi:hyperosmotically inducible protein